MEDRALEIRLIGELAVFKNGEPVALPQSKKTRALLVYLILNKGAHRRERLCEIFWDIPDDPRGSLRWSLSKLRTIVNEDDAERIKADRNVVSFEPANAHVDYILAEEIVENGLEKTPVSQLAELSRKFETGFLEDLALSGQPEFETWRLSQQERARKVYGTILHEWTSRLAENPSAQADRLYEHIRIEPYDIALHEQLISALARAGRKKEIERQLALSKEALAAIEDVDLSRLDKAAITPAGGGAAPLEKTPQEASLRQEIRFCKTNDGLQIAYASVGKGPPLVKTANWLNHLEFDWESPVWSHVFHALSNGRQFLRYDARGNGLSDWHITDFSIERQVEDLEAVVGAAGLDKFPLIGISQGCAISALYAARHPEKVTKLILYGGYARGWKIGRSKKYARETQAMITLIRTGWGQDNPVFRQMFAGLFMPDAPAENHQWFNELQRMTTSPANAAALLEALGVVDVRDCLPTIKAPTLVLHAQGDMRVPFDAGREFAAGIRDAQFVALETNNHLIPESDLAWPRFVEAVDAFLSE